MAFIKKPVCKIATFVFTTIIPFILKIVWVIFCKPTHHISPEIKDSDFYEKQNHTNLFDYRITLNH